MSAKAELLEALKRWRSWGAWQLRLTNGEVTILSDEDNTLFEFMVQWESKRAASFIDSAACRKVAYRSQMKSERWLPSGYSSFYLFTNPISNIPDDLLLPFILRARPRFPVDAMGLLQKLDSR